MRNKLYPTTEDVMYWPSWPHLMMPLDKMKKRVTETNNYYFFISLSTLAKIIMTTFVFFEKFFMTGTVSTRVQWAWLFRQWKTGRPASLWCRRWCGRDWHYSTGWTNRTGFWPCLRRCRDVPTKSATRAVSKVLARSGRRVRVRPTHSSSWSAQAASGCGRSTSS